MKFNSIKLIWIFMLCISIEVNSQEGRTSYDFLRISSGAHASALGGDNISAPDDDPSFVQNNPALLANVSDKSIHFGIMSYMDGVYIGSVSYSKVIDEKSSWTVVGKYMNYGSIKEMDAEGVQTGTFNANEVVLGGVYNHALSENLSGGIAAKFITSSIAGYNSIAVGVDLGLNYLNAESDLSVSVVAKNLGGQIKAYSESYERLPADVQAGISKCFGQMPIRMHLTLVDLVHWNYLFRRHVVLGADVLLGEQFYISAGYNWRRANEMTLLKGDEKEGNFGAGLSLGAGLTLEKLKINVAWAKYHVSSNSLILNLTYTL